MSANDSLLRLLPDVYTIEDAAFARTTASGESIGPLQALLRVIARQAEYVDGDIAQLWDAFFIETCEAWVIPYIGDLLGVTPLFDASRSQPDLPGDVVDDLARARSVPDFA